jgi:hypothetical protein
MNEKKWNENIPDGGVLCKENSSGSIVRILSKSNLFNGMVMDDCVSKNHFDTDELTPLTAEEWWQFAPWQDMDSAPLLTQIFISGERDFEDGTVFNIVMLHDDEQRGWYKKWLPLPKADK